MKKTLIYIIIALSAIAAPASAQSVFNSNQIATGTPSAGYVILSTGPNAKAQWVATSSLGIVSGSGAVSSVSSSDGSLTITPSTGSVDAILNQVQVDGGAFTTIDMLGRQLWNAGAVVYDWSSGTLYPASDIQFPNQFAVLRFGSDPSTSKSGLPLRLLWDGTGGGSGWLAFDDGAGNFQTIRANINADSVSSGTGNFSTLSGGTVSGDGSALTGVLHSGNNVSSLTNDAGYLTSATEAWRLGSGFIRNATTTDLVGIGTTTPYHTLDIRGKGGAMPIRVSSSTGAVMFEVEQNGNFGIGTTTAGYLLTVQGDHNQTGALRFNGNSGTAGQILVSNGSSAPTWNATSTLGTGQVRSGTACQAAYYQASGSILNGTSTLCLVANRAYVSSPLNNSSSSPVGQLTVMRNGSNNYQLVFGHDTLTSYATYIMDSTGGTTVDIAGPTASTPKWTYRDDIQIPRQTAAYLIGLNNAISETGSSAAYVNCNGARASTTAAGTIVKVTADPAQCFAQAYNVGAWISTGIGNGAASGTSYPETQNTRLLVDLNGNVGIGDSSPDAFLDISSSTAAVLLRVDDSGDGDSSPFLVDGNGSVGMGTTTPISNLHVTAQASNATSTFTLGRSGQTKGSCIELFSPNGTAVYLIASTTSPYGVESSTVASCR